LYLEARIRQIICTWPSFAKASEGEDGKNHASVSLRFVGAQHASLITASEKSYPEKGILLSGLHAH
jgi:hypothetical protein